MFVFFWVDVQGSQTKCNEMQNEMQRRLSRRDFVPFNLALKYLTICFYKL